VVFKELVDLARANGRLLQLGYMWRFNSGLNAMIEAAKQGWLGKVFQVRASMNTLIDDEERAQWGEFRGGALFEQGSHLIDAVVRLLGAPTEIRTFLKTQRSNLDNLADNTLAVLEYPSALATVSNCALQPNAGPHRYFEVAGTNGSALLKPIEPPELELDLATSAGPYRAGRQTVKFPDFHRYEADFAELAEAIQNHRPLRVSLEQELEIHQTLMRACGM
jgi:predicted dehydrogenase